MTRHISEAFYATAWAMHPPKLREIEAVIRSRFFVQRGPGRPRRLKAQAPAAARSDDRPYALVGRAAVLGLYGVISQRMNLMTDFSGGTSTELFGRQLEAAIADPEVGTIVLDVDSPGGSVYGVPEIADRVYQARQSKRIVAVCNSLMASAAYWIGSACSEIVLTPSGHVGSIGVFMVHEDFSGAEAAAGVKTTLISAGKYKVEGNPYEPLGDDARANIQADVDHYYTMFVNAVARNRSTTPDAVRGGYGQGRVLNSSDALGARLVDRIGTIDSVVMNERARAGVNSLSAAKARQIQAEAESI